MCGCKCREFGQNSRKFVILIYNLGAITEFFVTNFKIRHPYCTCPAQKNESWRESCLPWFHLQECPWLYKTIMMSSYNIWMTKTLNIWGKQGIAHFHINIFGYWNKLLFWINTTVCSSTNIFMRQVICQQQIFHLKTSLDFKY